DATALAATLGVPCFVNYVEMLDQVRPEAAIIAAPNVLHVRPRSHARNMAFTCWSKNPLRTRSRPPRDCPRLRNALALHSWSVITGAITQSSKKRERSCKA